MFRRAALAVLLSLAGGAGAAGSIEVKSENKAIQLRTDELLIHSPRIGRDFLVEITLLDKAQPGKKYAAVYAVDGGLGVAGPASRLLVAGHRTAPYFAVSIGYPNSLGRHLGPRNTDLAHERRMVGGREFGGGGAAFAAFIRDDLRPYLEKRYPLDPARAVLLGHSAGGMFAAHVLVTSPESYAGYVIGGMPFRFKEQVDTFFTDRARASAARASGQRVFVGLAPPDALNTGSDQFAALLSGPGSKLAVKQELFADETHNSEYLQLLARGLPYVLPTETAAMAAVGIDPALLGRYVGRYRLDAERIMEISRRGNGLFGRINTLDEGYRDYSGFFPLEPASDTQFFSRPVDVILTFAPPKDGRAPSLVARTVDQEMAAPRE